MLFRRSRALACVATMSVLALGAAACGGSSKPKSTSASDATSGLTVTVAGDQVTLTRSAKSTAGTAGTAGQVACTDDYAQVVKATAAPAPTKPWYAATLITWPAAGKASPATLSHALKGDPQLCIAQTADSSTQAIIYFSPAAKAGVKKLQTASAQKQQAAQATQALQAAAQAGVGAASSGSFPASAALVQALTAGGLYVQPAASIGAVTDTGTVYVLADQTTTKKLVLALKDSKGTINTATQGVTGSPKLATVKP